MDDSHRSDSGFRSPRGWALLAGGYAFACGALVAVFLSDVLRLFVDVAGLPSVFPVPLLAAPALVVGPPCWWRLVERREAFSYRAGAAFGLLTALGTGTLWTGWFVAVWGVELLAAGPVLSIVSLTLGFAAVAGLLVGVPLAYVRRRVGGGVPASVAP
ncbi:MULTISPECIES: hypothetical protein [Halorubrum]|uniref:Uncharacterized protein n=1 Tax=Halorubrum hochstenium ATCC 700873 TaxID=1227481 RepID=M0FKY7_9EURY|nr:MULTISPECIES: hypothetical protein [Halorubrum]ELZ60580.1 hypothetical protein C467_02208 [Halorubrum hochstenium ATCC 700873]